MTYEETLNLLEDHEYWAEISTFDEMAITAIEAVKKQIPKKPLPDNKYYGNGTCPSCLAVFLDKSTKYCGNCGQALDWSNEEC